MLLVIEPHDRHQQWLGVADIMKAEAHEAADQKLDAFSARANGVAGITPERVIRDGDTIEGMQPGEKWRCLQEKALIPPGRLVIDIDPGERYAAGQRFR